MIYLRLEIIKSKPCKSIKYLHTHYFIENRLVVIGGHGKSIEIINEAKDLTCSIPSYPTSEDEFSSTLIPTGILVCGGTYVNTCYQYKTSTSSWQSFPSMRRARGYFDMIYLNDVIWVFGGVSNGAGSYLEYFDMNSNRWTEQSMPFNVGHHCVAKINQHQLILIGGVVNSVSEKRYNRCIFS